MNKLHKELLKDNRLLYYWKYKTLYPGKRKTVVYRQILNACGNDYDMSKTC